MVFTMNNVKDYLKIKSKFKYITFLFIYFSLYPICKLMYGSKKNWLICERGADAQDNAFVFFKYLVENHKQVNPIFLIKKSSPEFEKVAKIGKTIEFGSFRHFLMVIGCPVKISSHLFGYAPWKHMSLYFRRNKTHDTHVFLQHGITKNDHKGLYSEACKSLKLFVCGALPEFNAIYSLFNYKNNVPQYTGFARYDLLEDSQTKKQILIMPTWRADLSNVDKTTFFQSDYYNAWNSLLNNDEMAKLCAVHNICVKFYLHYSMQKYADLFKSKQVKIVKFGEETVQSLLKESSLLITDFSSVYFDFAYMMKPVVYYQFDENTFNNEHYEKGYFDYRRDGFGTVCNDLASLTDSVDGIIRNNFKIDDKYKTRVSRFFVFRDKNNCERIYNCICNLRGEK